MKQLVNLDFTPEDVLRDFYPGDTPMFNILLQHSRQVCSKALALLDTAGGKFSANRDIVVYGAMLHDIGIGRCHAPGIFCSGNEPYIRHGVIGGGMLREWGRKYGTDMEVFARICERHTGSGISAEEIVRQGLPLPAEDFFPETPEEEIICVADKFFSKSGDMQEKSVEEILKGMKRFGEGSVARWNILYSKFF